MSNHRNMEGGLPSDELWNPVLDEFAYLNEKFTVIDLQAVVQGPESAFAVFRLGNGEEERVSEEAGLFCEFWDHACQVLNSSPDLCSIAPLTPEQREVLEGARLAREAERARHGILAREALIRDQNQTAMEQSDEAFRSLAYSRVVGLLAPIESALDRVHVAKLKISRRKVSEEMQDKRTQ